VSHIRFASELISVAGLEKSRLDCGQLIVYHYTMLCANMVEWNSHCRRRRAFETEISKINGLNLTEVTVQIDTLHNRDMMRYNTIYWTTGMPVKCASVCDDAMCTYLYRAYWAYVSVLCYKRVGRNIIFNFMPYAIATE